MFTGRINTFISVHRELMLPILSLENIPFLGVRSLEMENLLKLLLFNMVSGETTSNAVWK